MGNGLPIGVSALDPKSKIGFYFHIPFCPHICPYCDFIKTNEFQKKDVDIYFEELLNQLNYFLELIGMGPAAPAFAGVNSVRQVGSPRDDTGNSPMTPPRDKNFATVYFGGGTPGLFKANYYKPIINKLKEYFTLEEITLETNPFTNFKKNFLEYKKIGFDRITLGAQSLCPNTLKILGRKHTSEDVIKNIQWAKEAGFDNIQVDLIYGLKKEIRSIPVQDEIKLCHEAGASGISAYFLTLEKNTLFANSNLVDEDNGVEEYLQILNESQKIGFEQIETSNFSKFGAKHNHLYWTGKPYIGIGTGAHGLLPASPLHPYGIRYKVGQKTQRLTKGNDILIYRDPQKCQKNFDIIYEEPRTKLEALEENMFTHLRTQKGISLLWLSEMTGHKNIVQIMENNAKFQRALAEGKLHCKNNFITLSAEEKIRGDAWALDLISLLL